MKHFAIVLLFFLAVACGSEKTDNSNTETNTNIVADFLNNETSLEDIEKGNPIVLFKEQAKEEADKVIHFSKDNIETLLSEAENYKYCVITTGDHTIVKITDLSDCIQSGSWGACMPVAKGYIKKKALVSQEDYINNIIGMPDGQDRVAFLFE